MDTNSNEFNTMSMCGCSPDISEMKGTISEGLTDIDEILMGLMMRVSE